MYQTSIEVSLFENTYFVNKLYIVKYVFLHRQFFVHAEFLVQFWKSLFIYLKKEKKRWKVREHDYLKWFTAKSI